jgi:hypothetical protein
LGDFKIDKAGRARENPASSLPKRIFTNAMTPPRQPSCKHPQVRIVARAEDTEFVECQECGEVFDSDEFRDMQIEDGAGAEDAGDAENA